MLQEPLTIYFLKCPEFVNNLIPPLVKEIQFWFWTEIFSEYIMSHRASLARLPSDSGLLESSCIHCWQLKDRITQKGQGGLFSFFFPFSVHHMRLSILTDNPVTEEFYTSKRQPPFHSCLCDLRI